MSGSVAIPPALIADVTTVTGAQTLEVRLLGELEVLRGGQRCELPRSRRTRALLAYLVTRGDAERRDRLCDLLWQGPNDPRAALRWSLTKLRPLLDDPDVTRLEADRERVRFLARNVSVDLDEFAARLAPAVSQATTDDLRAALRLVRGPFLYGLELDECVEFSSWQAGVRERLRTQYLGGLAELVARLEDRPDEALGFARQWVEADPYAEAAHMAVLERLGALGRARDLRAAFDACTRLFQQELQRGPSEMLLAALRRAETLARSQRPVGASGAATQLRDVDGPGVPPSSVRERGLVPRFALVGRDDEFAQLLSFIGRATRPDEWDLGGNARMILVTGEPGIGKSRLLEELTWHGAEEHGLTLLYGRAYEAESVRPYGPWIDALRPEVEEHLRRHPGLSSLVAGLRLLLPDLVSGLGAESREATNRTVLFEHVLGALDGLRASASASDAAAPRGYLLVLDDLQWFDDASVALLHFVMRNPSVPVVVAAAARAAPLSANAAASGLVRGLTREGRVEELHLGPLTDDGARQLVALASPAADADAVVPRSDGNPLFAIELARMTGARRDETPRTLDAVVGDHLARLSQRARDVVAWAAAIGHAFDPDLMTLASGLTPAELHGALRELEDHEVIRRNPTSSACDFAHDVTRRVAYEQLSPARASAIHRAIASALVALDDPANTNAGDIARHAELGGDPLLAATTCATAGERCLRLFAMHDAHGLAARGLGLLAQSSLAPQRRLPIEARLYQILVHSGRSKEWPRDVLARLEDLASGARAAGLPSITQSAYYLISFIHYHSDDWSHAAEDSVRSLQASRASDPATTLRAMATTGRCLASIERDLPRAQTLLTEAKARSAALALAPVDIPWGLGILAQWRGEFDEAVELLTQAVSGGRRDEDYWPVCDALLRLACVEFERQSYAEVRTWCEALAPVAGRLGESSEGPLGETLFALSVIAEDGADSQAHRQLAAGLAELRSLDLTPQHEAPMSTTPTPTHLIAEHSYSEPLTDDKHSAEGRRLDDCLSAHGAKWIRSYLATDRRRMVCEFEAPDADAVRQSYRAAGLQFERVWTAHVYARTPEPSTA